MIYIVNTRTRYFNGDLGIQVKLFDISYTRTGAWGVLSVRYPVVRLGQLVVLLVAIDLVPVLKNISVVVL